MTKKIYKIKGMDCASCAMVIESDLEDAGVKARCSYATQTLEVDFDNSKLKEEDIKEIVKVCGFALN